MTFRASSDKQRAALKTATFASLQAGGGGTAIARNQLTRVNATMLSLYAAPHETERFAGLDVGLDLDLVAGQPFHARALASAQGFCLQPLDSHACRGAGPGLADVAALIVEARDVELTLITAIDDGALSPNEKRDIKREIAELRQVLDAIETKVDAA
ncbi:hypothetical protein [Aurantimonas sp. VKM B-3413]|uniref:hypothetical protein n=1 Tax=Aurantimonas sp. VKM B-3413 TaxID=2779401 RepID=UPI001E2BEC7C|nr:hypothetical protein [Aurantimonas sp. VKM B-3413]MCB8835960.1 hypothetical protein [Aurantimonas sp. VKM B-3413]